MDIAPWLRIAVPLTAGVLGWLFIQVVELRGDIQLNQGAIRTLTKAIEEQKVRQDNFGTWIMNLHPQPVILEEQTFRTYPDTMRQPSDKTRGGSHMGDRGVR